MHENAHNPTISIVVPVYNVAPYVERCVLSVMRQTMPAAECIIVDDATEDDSMERCRRLIADYRGPTRFVLLRHGENRGLSAARNTGTDAATSDYVYYLDSDDEMTPDCLERLAAPIERDGTVEMVLGGCRKVYSEKRGLGKWVKERLTRGMQGDGSVLELRGNEEVYQWYYGKGRRRPDYVWNRLLKLSFVRENGLYNREGLLLEDRLWNFYLLRSLEHAVVVGEVTYLYRRRGGSIVTGTEEARKREHRGLIFREMAENMEAGQRLGEVERNLTGFCRNYVAAPEDANYRFAYRVFLSQMRVGGDARGVRRLLRARRMSRWWLGRALFRLVYNKRMRFFFN